MDRKNIQSHFRHRKMYNIYYKVLFENFEQKAYIKKTKTLINNFNKNQDLILNLINMEITPLELVSMNEKVK